MENLNNNFNRGNQDGGVKECSSLPTNAARIHLQIEQLSYSKCWTIAEDIGHQKGQEQSQHKQEGWSKKGKGIVRQWDKTSAPRGGTEEEKLLYPGKTLRSREITWGRRGAAGAWQCSNHLLHTTDQKHS